MGMSITFFLGTSPEFLCESNENDAVHKLLTAGIPTECVPFCLGKSLDGNFLPIAISEVKGAQVLSTSTTTTGNEGSRRKRGRPPKKNVETALDEVRENSQG